MTQPDSLREADQKALGGRAWDFRYWCSVHQLAHSARELMEEHTTSISSAPDLIAAVEALPGSATFGEVWINRRAVLALLRASREAGLDAERLAVTLHRRRHSPRSEKACALCARDAALIAAEYAASPAPTELALPMADPTIEPGDSDA